jgi:hypothetical protein
MKKPKSGLFAQDIPDVTVGSLTDISACGAISDKSFPGAIVRTLYRPISGGI